MVKRAGRTAKIKHAVTRPKKWPKKRAKKRSQKRAKPPSVAAPAQIDQGLRRRFPELDESIIRDNRAALLPYLKRDGDSNEKDYDSPGEFGTYARPHTAYVWLREKNDKSYWKELRLENYDECDTIVFEAGYREVNAKCPPDDGFATLVSLAEKQATDMITLHPCPDECGGSYFYTNYRKWFCQEDDVVVTVQVTRMCYVT